MINPLPLFIVLGTILALLAVQHLLARVVPSPELKSADKDDKPATPPPPPRPRGRPLLPGLSVAGLDERGTAQLKQLIREKNIEAVTTFLAFNRPNIIEVDQYLSQLRQISADRAKQSDPDQADRTPPPAPAGIQLDTLSGKEQQLLLSFDPKSQRLITRDLMSRFGGHEFSHHFAHYKAREKSVTLHVPPFDPDRTVLEILAKSGIADKGRHIPLPLRLTVLKMSQLRQMAKDLNLDKKFTRKQEAAETLAQVPGAAVLLSMQYVVDDLFVLKPIAEDPDDISHEWAYLKAYAKLLVSV
jgi:hypothetical protein